MAKFDRHEIIPFLGELLGRGGFNSVYELERISLQSSSTTTTTTTTATTTESSTSSSSSSSGAMHPQHSNNHHHHHHGSTYDSTQQSLRQAVVTRKPKLAVKFLSDEALENQDEFCNGAADLLMEAKYLTALASHPHPGLIQLHGICAAGPAGFGRVERAGFFLVIDRLYDTLDRRIDVWREVRARQLLQQSSLSNSSSSPPPPSSSSSSSKSKPPLSSFQSSQHAAAAAAVHTNALRMGLWIQRLLVAQDIASALKHLHKLQIVFRDLKPDNVGFDFEGRVKLFDFGLAKELDPLQQEDSGLYNMSGGTGSRRFMAPEVALSEPYHLSADIYSFSILFWEILSLDKAFGRLSVEEHKERVVKGMERPELDPTWSDSVRGLLEGCWKRSPFQRPTARDVFKALKMEIHGILAEHFPKQAAAEEEQRRRLVSAGVF